MKACKGLLLFCFLGLSVSSCFNPPEFSSIPEITIEKVQFKETPEVTLFDSLILYLNFSDGDGDLGLDPEDPRHSEVPYNEYNYFIANGILDGEGNGGLVKITDSTVYAVDGLPYSLLKVPNNVNGKLVFDKTRNSPGYGYLPIYLNRCEGYSTTDLGYIQLPVLVAESDNIIDPTTYNITDTLYKGSERYFVIEEPLYCERNMNHYNIEVQFLIYVGNNCVGDENNFCPFEVYDWYKNYCIDFNGRFPVLTNKKDSPVSGSIRYAMVNSSFIGVFGNTPLKLRVKIKDRALNSSKVVETPQFLLRR